MKVYDLEVSGLLMCYAMSTGIGNIAELLSQGQTVEVRMLRNVGN
jgi:hypothetical protein